MRNVYTQNTSLIGVYEDLSGQIEFNDVNEELLSSDKGYIGEFFKIIHNFKDNQRNNSGVCEQAQKNLNSFFEKNGISFAEGPSQITNVKDSKLKNDIKKQHMFYLLAYAYTILNINEQGQIVSNVINAQIYDGNLEKSIKVLERLQKAGLAQAYYLHSNIELDDIKKTDILLKGIKNKNFECRYAYAKMYLSHLMGSVSQKIPENFSFHDLINKETIIEWMIEARDKGYLHGISNMQNFYDNTINALGAIHQEISKEQKERLIEMKDILIETSGSQKLNDSAEAIMNLGENENKDSIFTNFKSIKEKIPDILKDDYAKRYNRTSSINVDKIFQSDLFEYNKNQPETKKNKIYHLIREFQKAIGFEKISNGLKSLNLLNKVRENIKNLVSNRKKAKKVYKGLMKFIIESDESKKSRLMEEKNIGDYLDSVKNDIEKINSFESASQKSKHYLDDEFKKDLSSSKTRIEDSLTKIKEKIDSYKAQDFYRENMGLETDAFHVYLEAKEAIKRIDKIKEKNTEETSKLVKEKDLVKVYGTFDIFKGRLKRSSEKKLLKKSIENENLIKINRQLSNLNDELNNNIIPPKYRNDITDTPGIFNEKIDELFKNSSDFVLGINRTIIEINECKNNIHELIELKEISGKEKEYAQFYELISNLDSAIQEKVDEFVNYYISAYEITSRNHINNLSKKNSDLAMYSQYSKYLKIATDNSNIEIDSIKKVLENLTNGLQNSKYIQNINITLDNKLKKIITSSVESMITNQSTVYNGDKVNDNAETIKISRKK